MVPIWTKNTTQIWRLYVKYTEGYNKGYHGMVTENGYWSIGI